MPAARCSILLALPSDRTEFDAVASGQDLPDYGRHLLRGGAGPEVWEARYSRVAAAIGELMESARSFGATVYRKARLADLARASSHSEILIVIAHWREWTISRHDFRADARSTCLRLVAGGLDGVLHSPAGTMPSLDSLARSLNGAIEDGEVLGRLAPELAQGGINRRLLPTLARDAIDELLGAMIMPGNRVELYDGLHTPGTIESAIDSQFDGDIDLSTCSSFSLATLISRRRGSRVALVHTLDAIDPLPCCLQIAATLSYLAEHGGRYASVRLAIQEQLQIQT